MVCSRIDWSWRPRSFGIALSIALGMGSTSFGQGGDRGEAGSRVTGPILQGLQLSGGGANTLPKAQPLARRTGGEGSVTAPAKSAAVVITPHSFDPPHASGVEPGELFALLASFGSTEWRLLAVGRFPLEGSTRVELSFPTGVLPSLGDIDLFLATDESMSPLTAPGELELLGRQQLGHSEVREDKIELGVIVYAPDSSRSSQPVVGSGLSRRFFFVEVSRSGFSSPQQEPGPMIAGETKVD